MDSLAHDSNRGLIEETAAAPTSDARVQALIDGETRIAADSESFQSFFEILPHALRDPDLRERVAALYDGYRETVLRCLDAARPEAQEQLRPFAMLMIAIVDGLAISTGSTRTAPTCPPRPSSGSAWRVRSSPREATRPVRPRQPRRWPGAEAVRYP